MKWIIVAAYLVFISYTFYREFSKFKQREKDESKKYKVVEELRLKDIERREKFKKEMEDSDRQWKMELADATAKYELMQAKSKAIKKRKVLLKIMAKQPTS